VLPLANFGTVNFLGLLRDGQRRFFAFSTVHVTPR